MLNHNHGFVTFAQDQPTLDYAGKPLQYPRGGFPPWESEAFWLTYLELRWVEDDGTVAEVNHACPWKLPDDQL